LRDIIFRFSGAEDNFMQRVKLDEIDRRILADLQDNGRVTNVELARRAGISAPPCLRRVRALEEAGFIRGYHADLNAESLGFGVSVFALVGLSSQAETDLVAFEERARGWPLVRECHMLAGEVDFILKIVAKDWDAYQHFLTGELTAAPNVAHVKTSLVIRSSKVVPGVPLDADDDLRAIAAS
jgi:DNA-binding Lrp family transcriptional regulator